LKIAIIPARGGSKRIPEKNIKLFHGKPIISYSLELAIESGLFDEIIVSTDDAKIADVAISYGAKVPFIRPQKIADDFTGTNAVVRHALQWFYERNITFQYACCIYATAPFLRVEFLEHGLELLVKSSSHYAFSVTTFPYPIQRALSISKEEGRIKPYDQDNFHSRSQDLEEMYHDAAQFYWGTSKSFLEGVPMFGGLSAPVKIPRYLTQDIDTEEDWIKAEYMFKVLKEGNSH